MSVDQMRLLADWNVWANSLVGAALQESGGMPENALAAFQHIFEAELTWLRRMAGVPNPNVPLWGPATLEKALAFQAEAAERMAWIRDNVSEAFLASTLSYTNSTGRAFTDGVELPLLHAFLHSQQYRGEAAAFLNAAGHRVSDMDFIFWHRLRAG